MNSAFIKQATITIGSMPLFVFQLPDGTYRLNQAQVAQAIGFDPQSFSDFLKQKTPVATRCKADRIKLTLPDTKISGISIEAAALYWQHHGEQGNMQAVAIAFECMKESIERRADAAFGVQKAEEERSAIVESKIIRRNLTDAIAAYLTRHPELSENRRKWIYVNVSDKISLLLFGNRVSKFRQKLNGADLRKSLNLELRTNIANLESVAAKLIEKEDLDPVTAIERAHAMLF